jgi:hypothetical protein
MRPCRPRPREQSRRDEFMSARPLTRLYAPRSKGERQSEPFEPHSAGVTVTVQFSVLCMLRPSARAWVTDFSLILRVVPPPT